MRSQVGLDSRNIPGQVIIAKIVAVGFGIYLKENNDTRLVDKNPIWKHKSIKYEIQSN